MVCVLVQSEPVASFERAALTEGVLVPAKGGSPELLGRTGEERKGSDFCFGSFAGAAGHAHTVDHSVYSLVAPGHTAARPPLQCLL